MKNVEVLPKSEELRIILDSLTEAQRERFHKSYTKVWSGTRTFAYYLNVDENDEPVKDDLNNILNTNMDP